MNRSEFVDDVATILFDAGVRMEDEEDWYMLGDCPRLVKPRIIGLYREFMQDVKVAFTIPYCATNTELWDLVYQDCFDQLCANDDLSNDIDNALWRIQNNREDDYDQSQEDRIRGEL